MDEIRLKVGRDGSTRANWKGGKWRRTDGRWMVRIAAGIYRLRYHVVWDAAHPDDPRLPGEIIHHMNHDPSDDRPENLMKITQSEHTREHKFGYGPHRRRGSER